ncbi:MAG: SCO family protein [Magnetococcus sp. XQGC-1]
MRLGWFLLLLFAVVPLWAAEETANPADPDRVLRLSQAAIGQPLPDLTLRDQRGIPLALASLRGKPVLLQLVYTSCYHTCSVATRSLASTVAKARAVFGQDGFHVLTVGFDTRVDTPQAMDYFARQQGVSDPGWHFLSGSAEQMQELMQGIGFTAFPSPKGFDHLAQVTVVDAQGVIYRQVYGETIPTPRLVEPLKELILGVAPAQESSMDLLVRRVRFFCTTYDPGDDAYRTDYSLFVGIGIGALCIFSVVFFLFREIRRNKTFS